MKIWRNGIKQVSAMPLFLMAVVLAGSGAAQAGTNLFVWDVPLDDLWMLSTSPPPVSTLIGGSNISTVIAEIEYGGGVIYGADTGTNTNLHQIDPATGVVFDTLTLTFPLEGNVLTSLEYYAGTLYAGLTTEGGGTTFLSTVDLTTGVVTVVGATGVASPLGGLAYDLSTSSMFAISSGGSAAELFTIDLGTGAATSIGPVTLDGAFFNATALEFGGDGVLYSLAASLSPLSGRLLTIDPVSTIATDLGPTGVPVPVALTAASAIFTDGFESGDTSAWSSSQ